VSGVRVQAHLQAGYRHLDFNTKNAILRDANIRQAIARAIDVPKIIATIYAGYGEQGATDIPSFSWAANDLAPIAYDPKAAVRMLQAAGWMLGPDGIRMKNGQRLALSISTATDNLPNANAEALISQELKAVGIDLGIKNYAGTVLFAPQGPLYTGRYDMSWIVDYVGADPDNLAKWGCNWFPPHGSNTDFYCNPQVDSLLTDAQTTFDVNRRRRDYASAWRFMLHDVPAMIIYWDKNVTASNSDLRNFKPSPVFTDYWNAWEWEI
jgi:peptide/nickel transport system substrate-binding protein